MIRISTLVLCIFPFHLLAVTPNWSKDAEVPITGRPNPYELSPSELIETKRLGKIHALHYPVAPTGALVPYHPTKKLMELPDNNFLKRSFIDAFNIKEPIHNMDDFFNWLGLSPYPEENDQGIYAVPYPEGKRPTYRMGATLRDTNDGKALTFSCASCHGGSLFGKRVLGLTTRFPRANEFFFASKKLVTDVSPFIYQLALGASSGEKRMYSRTRKNVPYIDSVVPLVNGLDTSLSHTALSLSRRAPDAIATKDPHYANNPQPEPLRTHPADSKPAVWWNLKYKNRWLSDGSVVSGNPIFTNFLWNELGRGTDLEELETWLGDSDDVVRQLTTAVFGSEAPRMTDFFAAESFDIEAAKRGQVVYEDRCAKCHGIYEKGWNSPNALAFSLERQLETILVEYHEQTPVINVGTDPNRYLGMVSLSAKLNRLKISEEHGIVVTPQEGYVPPPLVGIWARWPYFHNNSIPSLCALLTRAEDRPTVFYSGPANDKERDFDRVCNGYPLGADVPTEWKNNADRKFDSTVNGLGNFGHDEGIFLEEGEELLSVTQKSDLIVFLQTL